MPLDKLPVPTIAELQLQTTDVGSVFQTKMNAAVIALRNALIAYNNQIDAALTASQQVEPAPYDVAVAGDNNSYKMTPLRVRQAMDHFGLGSLSGPTELSPTAVRQNRMMAVNATWEGSPIAGTDGSNQGQILHMQHGDPTYAVDVFYSLSPYVGNLVRRTSANIPGAWERLITSTNMVGTMHQSGGAPALMCAVIERGSNVNGEYTKFADGTVFAWGTFEQSGLTISPAKSGFNETAVLVDPALPVSIINPVVTLGACEFRTATGQVVHTIQGRDLQGRSIFLNLGTGPMYTWPRLDTIGSLVITNATIRWSVVGRWR